MVKLPAANITEELTSPLHRRALRLRSAMIRRGSRFVPTLVDLVQHLEKLDRQLMEEESCRRPHEGVRDCVEVPIRLASCGCANMGSSQSVTLSDEMLEEYDSLTYLTKSDIAYIYIKFHSISPREIDEDLHFRIHKSFIMEKFPLLEFNPFSDRIFRVFSSYKDDHFSFEDMLDLCSAMDDECPDEVKAAWAFKIFDLNEDNQIGKDDIESIIDRLTYIRNGDPRVIDEESKAKIADVILSEMDLRNVGSMGLSEFKHAMSKIPEFADAFYFKL